MSENMSTFAPDNQLLVIENTEKRYLRDEKSEDV